MCAPDPTAPADLTTRPGDRDEREPGANRSGPVALASFTRTPRRTMRHPTAEATRNQGSASASQTRASNPEPSLPRTRAQSPRASKPKPSSPRAMAAATEKTAEDIRRELQELQRQHREVRPLSVRRFSKPPYPLGIYPDPFSSPSQITERLRDPRGLRRGAAGPGPGPGPGGPRPLRGFVRPVRFYPTSPSLPHPVALSISSVTLFFFNISVVGTGCGIGGPACAEAAAAICRG